MNSDDAPSIVVGIDGSPGSRSALSWAVDEATMRNLPLDLVHAWRPMFRATTGDALDPSLIAQTHGDALLAAAAGQVKVSAPTVSSRTWLVKGRPSEALLSAATGAYLLVVGSRGAGGFRGMQLGSVGLHAVAHATSPVAIVRARPRAKGPVVVGIDGSPVSRHVLAVAAEEAALRGSSLVVLWALYVHPIAEGVPDRESALTSLQATAHETLRPLINDVTRLHPEVDVRTSLPTGYPAEVLTVASATAQLLVVGSHGGGAFSGMRLGSISHALAHEAHCPLIVARPNP